MCLSPSVPVCISLPLGTASLCSRADSGRAGRGAPLPAYQEVGGAVFCPWSFAELLLPGPELSVLCPPWLSERPELWLEVQAGVDTSAHFFFFLPVY